MAFNFPEGSRFQFSSTFASAKTISALSNANPAVATSTAHGFITGDEILLTSGWEDAKDTIYKVTTIDANSFSIQGLNALSTSVYPAGTGIGSAQKISAFTDIPQVLTISSSGGDARYTDVQLLASRNATKIPTGFNATTTTLSLAHDPSQVSYQAMVDLSRTSTKVGFKVIGSGGTEYGYGYMSVSEVPSRTANQVNAVNVAISYLGRTISYAA
jgi:hypothetical protein